MASFKAQNGQKTHNTQKDKKNHIEKGLQLSSDNYSLVLSRLENRFGDYQLSTHISKSLSLKPVCSVLKMKWNFRDLFDKVEIERRSLENLGLDSKNYASFLVPVLMNKLPDELKLIFSWQFRRNVWKIAPTLWLFRDEIETRVKFNIENKSSENSNKKYFFWFKFIFL